MSTRIFVLFALLVSSFSYSQINWEEDIGLKIDEILDSFPERIDQFSMTIIPESQKADENNRQYMARISSEQHYLPYSLAFRINGWVSGKSYLIPEKTFTGKGLEEERKKKDIHHLFNPQSYRLMVTLPDAKTGGETQRFLQMTVRVYQLWILDNPQDIWEALVKKNTLQPVLKNDLGTIYSYIRKNGIGTMYYHLTGKGFLFSSPDIEAVKEMMAANAGAEQSLAANQKVKDILAISDYQQTLNYAFTLRAGERVRYDTAVALGATKECLDQLKENADKQIVPTFSYLQIHDLKKREATEFDVYSFESSSQAAEFFKKTSLQMGLSTVKSKEHSYDPKALEKKIEKKGNLVIIQKAIKGSPSVKTKG